LRQRNIRYLVLLAALFVITSTARAEEGEPRGLDTVTVWKWANTLIFAVGLGYLIAKSAPGFFNARSFEIQKAIKDATGLKIEAEFRSSEIDRKMATLADAVNQLKSEAAAEMEREHQRIRQDTAAEIERLGRHITGEVNAFRNNGIRQVRQHTARLALDLAEERLKERVGGSDQEGLLQDFAKLVDRGRN
jgi:F0F1-type ATP synthase membrane subunit b/b'